MERIKDHLGYLYRHNFMRYLFVGGSTFIIDFSLLIVLHGKFNLNIALATSVAYWVSILFNFTMNRWWTFSASENKKLHRHLFGYGLLLCFNYLFTVIFVSLVSKYISYAIAKIAAVIIQVSWTYLIYKNVIFVSPSTPSND